jgi:hypothetical protein
MAGSAPDALALPDCVDVDVDVDVVLVVVVAGVAAVGAAGFAELEDPQAITAAATSETTSAAHVFTIGSPFTGCSRRPSACKAMMCAIFTVP